MEAQFPRPIGARSTPGRGFTLVELMVVLSLLALLLAISFPRFSGSTENAKNQVRANNLETLRDALDKFHADQGRYPQNLAELTQRRYLKAIPLDPVSGTREWQPVAHPSGVESGVYDVNPPVEAKSAPPAGPDGEAAASANASTATTP